MATDIMHLLQENSGAMARRAQQRTPWVKASYAAAKRILDVALSLALLVMLAPLFALIALAILLDSDGPVLFKQERVLGGAEGFGATGNRTFTFLKFRTMRSGADQNIHQQYMKALINGAKDRSEENGLYKLGADQRITRVGRLLRKSSLDELPQLINILRGEMSFVGPRPAIPYEVEQYKAWYLERFNVKQGLTGLWQVSGRNALTFEQMIELDIAYVRRRSLALDIKIILATIPAVFLQRGAC